MAVFPDRIILKNSTDSEESLKTELSPNGPAALAAGEIVIRRDVGSWNLYSTTADDQVVGFLDGALESSSISQLQDVVITEPIAPLSILEWNGSEWINAPAPSYDISGNILTDLGDVAVLLPEFGEALVWDDVNSQWINDKVQLLELREVEGPDSTGTGNDGATLVYQHDLNSDEPAFKVRPLKLSEVVDDVGIISDGSQLSIGDLSNVDSAVDIASNMSNGSVLSWNGSEWTYAETPQPDLSTVSIDAFQDVDTTTDVPYAGTFLGWDWSIAKWIPRFVDYDDVDNRPTRLSDLIVDLNVSAFFNDAGYITGGEDLTLGAISDVSLTGLASGDVLAYNGTDWVNSAAPPADISGSSIRDLNDVNVTNNIIKINDVYGFNYGTPGSDSAAQQLGITGDGLNLELYASRVSDDQGVRLTLSRQYGYEFRSDVEHFRLLGNKNSISNEPILYWHAGTRTSGRYIGLKMPLDVTQDVTYELPKSPGTNGQVLATDFDSKLYWQDSSSITELGQIGNVDLATYPPAPGYVLTYDGASGNWIAQESSGGLSNASIDDLVDVRTSGANIPSQSQVLMWDNADQEWQPGNVALTAPDSIGDLGDVNTTTSPPISGEALIWGGSEWIPGAVPGTVNNLQLVGDVVYPTPLENGQFLRYNLAGYQWQNHTMVLSDNDDVSITGNPSGGSFLRYNNVSDQWEEYTLAIADASDVDTTFNTPVDGTFLGWDSSLNAWTSKAPNLSASLDSLTDVSTAGATNRNILRYNQVAGQWESEATPEVQAVLLADDAPTTRADGTALVNGDSWWEQDASKMYIRDGGAWVESGGGSGGGGATSINDLTDVDTLSNPPTDGQILAWNDTDAEWVPAAPQILAGTASTFVTQTQATDASGHATFSELGYSGIFRSITSDVDAWITVYSSSVNRGADSGRAFDQDPALSSGILVEIYATGGTAVEITPTAGWMNNDANPTSAVYVAARTVAGNGTVANVTISGYGITMITEIGGLTFGSGV